MKKILFRVPRTKEFLAVSVIFLLVLTSWAMLHVWSRNYGTEIGYAFTRQKSINEELFSENKTLRLEISTLKSSKRLEAIAKDDMGLQPPGQDQVIYIWKKE